MLRISTSNIDRRFNLVGGVRSFQAGFSTTLSCCQTITGSFSARFWACTFLAARRRARFGAQHEGRGFGRFAGVCFAFHLPCECAAIVRARRGKVFARRINCATLRIFSAKGSRASFWRISGFITLAVSAYAGAARLPNKFCRDRPAAAVARCAPCPWPARHWRQWPPCARRETLWRARVRNQSAPPRERLLGQSVGGEKLHRESAHQQMLALDLPALGLQMAGMPAVKPLSAGMEKCPRRRW